MVVGEMPTLSQVAVEIAVSKLGVHEIGGNNRGPEVATFLAAVGLPPGYSWCMAFVFWVLREAARRLQLVNPCPRTAKAVKLWEFADAVCRDSNPSVGALYVLDHGPPGNVLTEWQCDWYGDDGHVGFVAFINDSDVEATFELPDVIAALARFACRHDVDSCATREHGRHQRQHEQGRVA